MLQRCVKLLSHSIDQSLEEIPDKDIHPSEFQDDQVRKFVESTHPGSETSGLVKISTKRRKVSPQQTDALQQIFHCIYETLKIEDPADDEIVVFEQLFLYVITVVYIDAHELTSSQGRFATVRQGKSSYSH